MGKVNQWRQDMIDDACDKYLEGEYGYYTAVRELEKCGLSVTEATDLIDDIEEGLGIK